MKGVLHPGANDSINFADFPHARPDETNYKQYDTTTDKEKSLLAKVGKSVFCKQSGQLARNRAKKHITSNAMQVTHKLEPKIKSGRVVIEDKETSALQLAKPPTDERIHLSSLSNKIQHAAEIRITGAIANVIIDQHVINVDIDIDS